MIIRPIILTENSSNKHLNQNLKQYIPKCISLGVYNIIVTYFVVGLFVMETLKHTIQVFFPIK